MIMIWRSAMPLLTTLAALVIIVHCVEEDLETDYRHDLRPRILDTGTSNYDQTWRVVADEPVPQKSRQTENSNDGLPEETRKRRRPGRKRKRRPQLDSQEAEPQERYPYFDESPRPYYDVDSENVRQQPDSVDIPKRRRKPMQRPIRWTNDDVSDMERPLRKNVGRRKKRPAVETWPESGEFREFNTDIKQEEAAPESPDQGDIDFIRTPNLYEINAEKVFNYNRDIKKPKIYIDMGKHFRNANKELYADQITGDHLVDDKSLSELSSELGTVQSNTDHEPKIQQIKTRIPEIFDTKNEPGLFKPEYDENANHSKTSNGQTQENSQIHDSDKSGQYRHQLSLKEILRRSNGTSLSELLQQHNVTLTDLLHGKENAVSVLQSRNNLNDQNKNVTEENKYSPNNNTTSTNIKKDREEKLLINSETKYATEPLAEYVTTTQKAETEIKSDPVTDTKTDPVTTTQPTTESVPKISTRRRYPSNLRKKLRMRPTLNTTSIYKGQLSRDLIALNARKYSHHRRNTTKLKEWKDVIPSMLHDKNTTYNNVNNETISDETTTIEITPEETTLATEIKTKNILFEEVRPNIELKLDDIEMDATESTKPDKEPVIEIITEIPNNVTEKPIAIATMARPTAISSGLRQQALNNRLKRKRLKHKNSTTEPPQDDIIKHLFGMGNLVASTEFIAKTQEPKTTEKENTELTTLDDIFVTTERINKNTRHPQKIATAKAAKPTRPRPMIQTTTEGEAKVEIEEILNDAEIKTKLSRILAERNMTLSALVEHRERGSSHIHLADIFHNASREPNPAEPFLSKSLLEPISKETYPLRAILEANLHEQNGKVTTIDPSVMNTANIPVVMNFGNNVNENAENMGIVSLFDKFAKNTTQTTISPGLDIKNSTVPINNNITTPKTGSSNDTVRESRVLGEIQDDVVSWNEIFEMMGRSRDIGNEEISSIQPYKSMTIEEDADGDGLIALEDLQRLADSGSYEKVIEKSKEDVSSIPDKIPSPTRSVTVATATIAGLSMVLFLMTYVAFKWKQQRKLRRRSFSDERIPTPVFENRKGHKNNSSSRSISPMLHTSNIYTLNTLDSQNGKESPDYMWDSLRKPFQ